MPSPKKDKPLILEGFKEVAVFETHQLSALAFDPYHFGAIL